MEKKFIDKKIKKDVAKPHGTHNGDQTNKKPQKIPLDSSQTSQSSSISKKLEYLEISSRPKNNYSNSIDTKLLQTSLKKLSKLTFETQEDSLIYKQLTYLSGAELIRLMEEFNRDKFIKPLVKPLLKAIIYSDTDECKDYRTKWVERNFDNQKKLDDYKIKPSDILEKYRLPLSLKALFYGSKIISQISKGTQESESLLNKLYLLSLDEEAHPYVLIALLKILEKEKLESGIDLIKENITKALQNQDTLVASSKALELIEKTQTVQWLQQINNNILANIKSCLKSEGYFVRKAALNIIKHIEPKLNNKQIRSLLKDVQYWIKNSNIDTKVCGLETASKLKHISDLLKDIKTCLIHKNIEVRRAALNTIESISPKLDDNQIRILLNDIKTWIESDNNNTKIHGLNTAAKLDHIKINSLFSYIKPCLRNKDPDVREAALNTLKFIAPKLNNNQLNTLLDDIKTWIKDDDVNAKEDGLNAVSQLDYTQINSIFTNISTYIISCLKNDDYNVSKAALDIICAIGPKLDNDQINPLLDYINTSIKNYKNWHARRNALDMICAIAHKLDNGQILTLLPDIKLCLKKGAKESVYALNAIGSISSKLNDIQILTLLDDIKFCFSNSQPYNVVIAALNTASRLDNNHVSNLLTEVTICLNASDMDIKIKALKTISTIIHKLDNDQIGKIFTEIISFLNKVKDDWFAKDEGLKTICAIISKLNKKQINDILPNITYYLNTYSKTSVLITISTIAPHLDNTHIDSLLDGIISCLKDTQGTVREAAANTIIAIAHNLTNTQIENIKSEIITLLNNNYDCAKKPALILLSHFNNKVCMSEIVELLTQKGSNRDILNIINVISEKIKENNLAHSKKDKPITTQFKITNSSRSRSSFVGVTNKITEQASNEIQKKKDHSTLCA